MNFSLPPIGMPVDVGFREIELRAHLIEGVHDRFFLPCVTHEAFDEVVPCDRFPAQFFPFTLPEIVNDEPARHADGDKQKGKAQDVPGVFPIIGNDMDDCVHDDRTSVFGDNVEDRDGIKNNRQSGNNLARFQWRPFRGSFDVVSKVLLKGRAIVNKIIERKGGTL